MEAVKKKNGLVLLFCVLFIVLQVISLICDGAGGGGVSLSHSIAGAITALVCVFLYISYRSHVKNVMKPLLGASLILSLGYEMSVVCAFIEDMRNAPTETAALYGGSSVMVVCLVVNLLLFAAIVGINVFHYLINSTHASSPSFIKINGVFFIYYGIMTCIRVVLLAACCETTALGVVSTIADKLSYVFTIGIVWIIEVSLDEFRIAREQKEAERER